MNKNEEVTQSILSMIATLGVDHNTLTNISNIMYTQLKNYDIVDKCTEVAVVDNSSERILKLFFGTLLTEGKAKSTVEAYKLFFKNFLYEIGKQLNEVKPFDIRVYFAEKQKEVSLRTCENQRSILSSFYYWQTNNGLISTNPMSNISPIKYEEEVKLPFSDVELDKLRMNCVTLRERAELELMLSSGVRVSELCALDISDIDFRTNTILVRKGKGNKQRMTYMDNVCAGYLQRYLDTRKDDDPCLFLAGSNSCKRISKATVEFDLKKIGERSGIQKVHPHRCRRTFATNLAKKKMDIQTISQLMGHSNISTTTLYISLDNTQIKNAYAMCM